MAEHLTQYEELGRELATITHDDLTELAKDTPEPSPEAAMYWEVDLGEDKGQEMHEALRAFALANKLTRISQHLQQQNNDDPMIDVVDMRAIACRVLVDLAITAEVSRRDIRIPNGWKPTIVYEAGTFWACSLPPDLEVAAEGERKLFSPELEDEPAPPGPKKLN